VAIMEKARSSHGARREHALTPWAVSPPTIVAWVPNAWFSSLLRGIHKNKHSYIPVDLETVDEEPLCGPATAIPIYDFIRNNIYCY